MSGAFSLMMDLVQRDADVTAMFKAWMDLSDAKGWPKTEEGWRRYLSRMASGDSFPTVAAKRVVTSKEPPPPEEFSEWWKNHPEGGLDGPILKVAWSCERYRKQWTEEGGAVT